MNAHTPFDANQDWTNPYCQNSSNDPMVDALLGNAYHVVRTVYCNLGNLKLIYDFLNQYGMVLGVQSEAELKALTTKATFARIYDKTPAGDRQVTDYLYVEGDRTGVIPDDATATGSWVKVATSGSSGGSESTNDGGYIPWIYNSGSAVGGETTVRIPDETAGAPFIIVNGDWQTEGYDFEYDPLTFEIKFTTPLEQGDFVVVMRTGVPANPDNPNVSDWVTFNWLYNQGAAVGGEQVINIPYTFQSVPAVYKNGLRFYKGLANNSYTIDSDNNRIILTEPLATNDRLIVQLGGEARVLEITDHTIQEVARAVNVKDSEVILSTDTSQVLNGKTIIFDVVTQRIYGLPTLPTNVYISTVIDGQLTYNPGSVVVNLLPAPNDAEVFVDELKAELSSPTGHTLVPSVEIDRWKATGDIRGWGATNGGYNDDAIAAALASGSSSVSLGGKNFTSKIRNPVVMPSNVVLHSGNIVADYLAGVQQEVSAIVLPNVSNVRIIDVDITGTVDGGVRGYGGANLVIDGVNVHDIGISMLSGECGIGIWFGDYANYDVQTDGLLIQNCNIKNIGGVGMQRGDGILVYNAKNFKVRHNTIITTNRMGIAAGSDTRQFEIHGNYIGDTLLAGIDIEPDSVYTASNGKVYNNNIVGFASRYFTEGAGVGQTFGIDIHANTSYIKVYGNTLSAGQYGTEAFHIGNLADEIEVTDNDLIGGAVVIPLFIKTYDGSGSKHIKINRNRAKGTCKSFADVYMSEDVYISENVFSGDSSNDSYFLRASTIAGLNVDYNRSSNTTNFIKSGDAGTTSNVKVTNNNISTLSDGINMLTSGSMTGFIASGNTILCPASNKGISLEVTGSGSISDISLRGNIIYNATTKIYVSPAATGWDMLTKNTRFDLSGVQNGTQLFELSKNRVTQFLNGIWVDS